MVDIPAHGSNRIDLRFADRKHTSVESRTFESSELTEERVKLRNHVQKLFARNLTESKEEQVLLLY